MLPPAGADTRSHFAWLLGSMDAVVVWGAARTDRQVMVTDGGVSPR